MADSRGSFELARRGRNRLRRMWGTAFARRNAFVRLQRPIISFTFDDFPRSALYGGGRMLEDCGAAGTYYASLGLMDQDSPVGRIFSAEDLAELMRRGHELGCHTYAHSHAWETSPVVFEESIAENRKALQRFFPEARFKTMSYPLSLPHPAIKRSAGRHFLCCRGGEQTYNVGRTDLNNVRAFFLEQSRERPEAIEQIITENSAACGWLVFATHDIDDRPTRFGCTPALFEKVVRWATDSGARILPVARALEGVTSR